MFWKTEKKQQQVTKGMSVTEVVEEIHRSFNTASDRAVEEARAILESIPQDNGDAAILEAVGFTQTKKVVEAKENERKSKMAKEEAELIMYYQYTYPMHKFILDRQVTEICQKYNLVCGDVSRYRGTVPSKNVQEIGRFDAKKWLKPEDRNYLKRSGGMLRLGGDEDRSASYTEYKASNPVDSYIDAINRGEMSIEEAQSSYGKYVNMMYRDNVWENTKFHICAPLADMDTSGMRLENHRLKQEIPDPIVLYPCKSLWCIVSAWGPEASDEIVVNQKMN